MHQIALKILYTMYQIAELRLEHEIRGRAADLEMQQVDNR